MEVPVHELFSFGTQEKIEVKIKELGPFIAMRHCQGSMKPVDSSSGKKKSSVQILSKSYGK